MRKHLPALVQILFVVIFVSRPPSAALCGEEGDPGTLSKKYESVFHEVEKWLDGNPILKPGDAERERILKMLDEPLLAERAKEMPVVGWFFGERMKTFLEDFERTEVKEVVVIWKLYNHTEVIKTSETTIVIDLIQGFDQVFWPDESIDRAIEGIDLLLITHEHDDHADLRVVKKFLDAGKKVIAPPGFWEDEEDAKGITRLRGDSLSFNEIKITAFPAYQKLVPNNVYLLELKNGIKIMHLGDDNETFRMGTEWFRRFKNKPLEIDVLIPNCWSPNLALLTDFVKPKIIISSHEHEIGHPPEGRRPYNFVYSVLGQVSAASGVPFIVPMWGEKTVFKPELEKQ
ncbi:MAG: MBL fold metallo-hydrolase [bacterium]